MRPSEYPPPFDPAEVIAAPSDPEPIEVGVLIVGAGPAGLACAIRLGQLLEDGARRRRAARRGAGGRDRQGLAARRAPALRARSSTRSRCAASSASGSGSRTCPSTATSTGESVYYLTQQEGAPDPGSADDAEPRQPRRLALAARPLARRAGRGGAARPSSPRPPARSCSSPTGACAACAPGDRGRGKDGEQLAKFEPGSDLVAQVTVLAEGTQGHLTGAAISRFGLEGENPQVWALGVKEVWKVAKPLDRVIHTMGWPLRGAREVPRVRRLVRLPDGRGHAHDRHGRRARLPRRRAVRARPAPGAEDAPEDPRSCCAAASGSRGARRRFPRAAGTRCRRSCTRPGSCSPATRAGTVNVPALKGIHYAVESGMLAAEAIFARAAAGRGRLAAERARAVRRGRAHRA